MSTESKRMCEQRQTKYIIPEIIRANRKYDTILRILRKGEQTVL